MRPIFRDLLITPSAARLAFVAEDIMPHSHKEMAFQRLFYFLELAVHFSQ
jgi:hypothetical protein